MEPRNVQRKLAAILAADIAGYSRLMGSDEAGTLAQLTVHRKELIDPKIAERLPIESLWGRTARRLNPFPLNFLNLTSRVFNSERPYLLSPYRL